MKPEACSIGLKNDPATDRSRLFQAKLGDPKPMFEWVLPPCTAKAAMPVLVVMSFAAFGALLARPPRR